MSLDATEQELYDFAIAAMPDWYKELDRTKEELYALAKIFGSVKKVVAYWFDMAMIGTATGPDAKDTDWDTDWAVAIPGGTLGPDWLEFHAEDRGTRRANGEIDAVMRERLRTAPDAVTRDAILAAAQAVVDAQTDPSVVGDVDMVEFPRDAAYLGTYTQDTGTGGTFGKVDSLMSFYPATAFAYPPYFGNISGRVKTTQITFSGCDDPNNDGTFEIIGLGALDDGDGYPTITVVFYTNASGAAAVDAGLTWATERLNWQDVVIDGHGRAYVNRGFRVWRGQSATGQKKAMGGVLLLLPYETTEGTRLAVREQLRQIKAAGIAGIVQRRIGAP